MFEQSTETVDQPVTESTNQDQVNEQADATADTTPENADNSGKTDEPVFEIDGEKLTAKQIKEYKLGYMRDEDYRKKTQELAEAKRQLAAQPKQEDVDPEVKAALDTLKQAGVVTKEDLALMKAQEEDAKQFRKLLKRHPELEAHKKALEQIGKTDNRAWEDLAVDYGFLTKDKLSKAKESRQLVGKKSVAAPKSKSIMDMDAKEYAEWKRQNIGDGLRVNN